MVDSIEDSSYELKHEENLNTSNHSDALPSQDSVEESKTSQNTVFKRDKTKMHEYYKAWDQFDIESELSKFEEAPQLAPSKMIPSIGTKSGENIEKNNFSEIEKLKELGNKEFSAKEYGKALEKYLECLLKEGVPSQIKVIVHSNCAECYLRLNSAEQALDQAEKALKIDAKHLKSLLRRAKAKEMLGKYRSAKSDLEECLLIDPRNETVIKEKNDMEGRRATLLEKTRNSKLKS